MKVYISLLVALLSLTNAALGAVGDVGVSDGYNLQTSSSYSAVQDGSSQFSGYQQPLSGSVPDQTTQTGLPQAAGLSYTQYGSISGQNYQSLEPSYQTYSAGPQSSGYPQTYPPSQVSTYSSGAPQLSGPYQERYSPSDLGLSEPSPQSFQPDVSLNFASSSPPASLLTDTKSTTNAVSNPISSYTPAGTWYYPGSVISSNRFYAQTLSGLNTVVGCSYGGYVPLWANIAFSDNFYVYEWYPGQTSPYVRWWGWTSQGWKKGWFSGDVSGWHILCFNCRGWSNYVYIYVWPAVSITGTPGSGYVQGTSSMVQSSAIQSSAALPSGAPTPPDINSENLMLPDYRMFSQGQSCNVGQVSYNSGSTGSGGYTCSGGNCIAQSVQTVFPKPSAYKCNEYYVQGCQGRLNTVGSLKCGEWLPLWSKIGKAGCYWSFEWTNGCSSSVSYCNPEVKNFGYKGVGWYSTWFRGDKPGWHVLSYYCNDWSNYIYIYVWSSN